MMNKSLAEFFASQREKSVKSVFSGDMCLGKNSSQPESVRAPFGASARIGLPSLFKQEIYFLFEEIQLSSEGLSRKASSRATSSGRM